MVKLVYLSCVPLLRGHLAAGAQSALTAPRFIVCFGVVYHQEAAVLAVPKMMANALDRKRMYGVIVRKLASLLQ